MTCYTVAGTQSQRGHANSIIVMKMSNLRKTQKEKKDDEEDDEEEESDSEDEDELPEMETALVKHTGSVNRIRTTVLGDKHFAATW
ncbi:glutamate-rich WD repeat-containing protein 1-like [Gigantopelta aegis]|uniref:glutamate-rich WD repeat-containing protein 1-like n=1 Tax=Gigantopelta aegis TaxID=1735272 RepID=UPI001B88923D|nr:glutamate-rich WD repeat-containing protein 1-like [Gigantopelta aegis]